MKNREGISYLPVFAGGGGAFRLISPKALRFALAFLCFSFAFSSYAADIFVAPEGKGEMTGANWSNALNGSRDGYHIDVKTAITDAVANGATEVNVYFAGGTYSITNELSLSSITIPVKLSGGYLAETDGSLAKGETATTFSRTANNVRHLSASSLSSLCVDGITFTGGNISAGGGKGGSIYVASSTTAISNCVFRNNAFANTRKDPRTAGIDNLGGGGAVSAVTSGSLFIYNCTFEGNHHVAGGTYNQSCGGAVLAYGVALDVRNSTFQNNYMNGASGRNTLFGGAIGTYNGNVSISNCTFSGNYILGATTSPAGASGGALAIRDAVSFKMSDSVFNGNYVASTSSMTFSFAAGIMLLDDWKASDGLTTSVVERCVFDSRTAPNSATGSRLAQSDILLSGGQLFMTNCLVFAAKGNGTYGDYSIRNLGTLSYSGTTTKYYGYVYSSVTCAESDMELVNCTVADGKAYGAVAVGDATMTLKNCISYGHSVFGVVDATSIEYSCLQEEHEGEGNFVPESVEALNWTGAPYYHLLTKKANGAITNGWFSGTYESARTAADSPCIDAGAPHSPALDFEPMPHGQRINLGAYGGTQWASMTSGSIGLILVVK